MHYCPNCFCGIDPEDKFCKNCGEPLSEEGQTEAGSEKCTAQTETVLIDNTAETVPPEEIQIQSDEEKAASQETEPCDDDENEADPSETGDDAAATAEPSPEMSEYTKTFIQNEKQTAENTTDNKGQQKDIISLGEWVLTLLLTYIPIVNLVMLIYWAASETTNPNKKNYARAQLIWTAVGIALSILFIILLIVIGIMAVSSYSTMYYY